MGLWPQFRSPLIWDVFAVSTYFTVSLLFWFTGLIPDLATLRDAAESKFARRIFGVLALGWRGSARHWQRYETIYLLLAGLSTPLVLSVHTIVSFDFAVSELPGWHATFFPPYFVAGAIYSGFAMVMTLAIPMRKAFGLEDLITMRHIHNMTKIMLVDRHDRGVRIRERGLLRLVQRQSVRQFMMTNRHDGAVRALLLVAHRHQRVHDSALLVQEGARQHRPAVRPLAARQRRDVARAFRHHRRSLHRDFLPSSWDMYAPTRWDFGMFTGTIGLFLSLFFLFVRLLPAISIFEVRTLVPEAKLKTAEHHG